MSHNPPRIAVIQFHDYFDPIITTAILVVLRSTWMLPDSYPDLVWMVFSYFATHYRSAGFRALQVNVVCLRSSHPIPALVTVHGRLRSTLWYEYMRSPPMEIIQKSPKNSWEKYTEKSDYSYKVCICIKKELSNKMLERHKSTCA